MIAFDLQCPQGHSFEGWFEDNNAFTEQQKKGLITCPVCDDAHITKLPTAFAIQKAPAKQVVPTSKENKAMIQMAKKVTDYIDKNFDDVGCDFTKEALKMHYGATESRNIRGVSTVQEEETLKKEGIQFFKFPSPAPPELPEPSKKPDSKKEN
jgi:hypothetical protein